MRSFQRIAALALTGVLAAQLCACAAAPSAGIGTPVDLMASIAPRTVEEKTPDTAFSLAASDFAAELLKQSCRIGENTTLSPYSVLTALAMTANGADGETLAQMEAVFGLPIDELNEYLSACRKYEGGELCSANSIWIREGCAVVQDFLQVNGDYYDADVYQTEFDAKLAAQVNAWVAEKTDGRIKEALDRTDPNAALYLVNALSFDAKWETPFTAESVLDEEFTAFDGTVQTVRMMHESTRGYLEDENAVGFVKYYAGGRYSFAALLPNDGTDIEDYVNQLDGKALTELMSGVRDERVNIALPRFAASCRSELSAALCAMGMPDAFSTSEADFSRMAPDVYIGRVLHQTSVAVDELGTVAGASTVVEMEIKSVRIEKSVRLDRPFVWMIWDHENNMPVFLGVTDSIS